MIKEVYIKGAKYEVSNDGDVAWPDENRDERRDEILREIFKVEDVGTLVQIQIAINRNLERLLDAGVLAERYTCHVSCTHVVGQINVDFFDYRGNRVSDLKTFNG